MDNPVVRRGTDGVWETTVSFERRLGTVALTFLFRQSIQFGSCDAGPDPTFEQGQRLSDDPPCSPHLVQLRRAL
jgi:hypothetical protein